jgi:CDP-diacylglycerol--serine O-phosphatidyltransferase
MNWRQAIPTAVTTIAMLAGFSAILLTIEGLYVGVEAYPYYLRAAQMIMLAMVLDGLDGILARVLHGESEFGAELDTFVDITAFGIAPAILVFAMGLPWTDALWARMILPTAIVLSGAARLARFKAKDPSRGQGGYTGLPITANGGWVAILVFISEAQPQDAFSLSDGWFLKMFLIGTFILSLLQVSSVRYPKPVKKKWMFATCFFLVVLLCGLEQAQAFWSAVVILSLGLGYAILGPAIGKVTSLKKANA